MKINLDDLIVQLKFYLVLKGYIETYGVDYPNTFSLVAKMTFV